MIRETASLEATSSEVVVAGEPSIDWAAFPARNKAVVLAGGLPQSEMARAFGRRGYHTAVVDWNEHAPAEEAADTYYQESTLDEQAVRQIVVRERAEVLSTCCTDQALCTMGRVASDLGVRSYLSGDEGYLVTNKLAMKRRFLSVGIPTAAFVEDPPAGEEPPIPLPVVVKPVDCNSSKGVVVARTVREYEGACAQARAMSRTGGVIIEELLRGDEYSIDAFVIDGEPVILCISRSDKLDGGNGFIICRGQYVPSEFRRLRGECEAIARLIVSGFGLANCPLLIQAIETKGGLRVVEFSARTGGSIKYRMVERASGVDVIDATTELACGGRPEINPVMSDKIVSNEFLYCVPGIIGEVRGLRECRECGIVDEYHVFKAAGSNVAGARSSGDRVAAFTIVAESPEEYRSKLRDAMSRVDVVDADGRSLLVR